jgi:hypothetical protein
MAIEEKRVRKILKHHKDIKDRKLAAERFKLEEMARRVEAGRKQVHVHRSRMATHIQRLWRGHRGRCKAKKRMKLLRKLQKFVRTKMFYRRYLAEKAKKQAFRSKINNNMRSTLFFGGRNTKMMNRLTFRRQSALSLVQKFKDRITQQRGSVQQRKINTLNLVTSILERKVVLIQSVWRMRRFEILSMLSCVCIKSCILFVRTRKRYLAKRRALGHRYPPMYRYLIPPVSEAAEDQAERADGENDNNENQENQDNGSRISDLSSLHTHTTHNTQVSANPTNMLSYITKKTDTLTKQLLRNSESIKNSVQKYFKDKASQRAFRKHLEREAARKAKEEAYNKRIRGIILLQAAVRGVITRQQLYTQELDLSMFVKKVVHYNEDAAGKATSSKKRSQKINKRNQKQALDTESGSSKSGRGRDLIVIEKTVYVKEPSSALSATVSTPIKQDIEGPESPAGDNRNEDYDDGEGEADFGPGTSTTAAAGASGRFRPNLTVQTKSVPSTDSQDAPESETRQQPSLPPATPFSNSNNTSQSSAVLSKQAKQIGSKLLSTANTASKALSEALSDAKTKAMEDLSAYLLRKKLDADRMNRRKNGIVSIVDAVMNVRGTLVSDLPTIERKWFIKCYPKASYTNGVTGAEVDNVNESWRDNAMFGKYETNNTESAVGATLSTAAKTSDDGDGGSATAPKSMASANAQPSESTQTITMFPFSIESFHDASVFLHLTDLTRYKSIEVVIFMENITSNNNSDADGDVLGPKSSASDGNIVRTSVEGLPAMNDTANPSKLTAQQIAIKQHGQSQDNSGLLWGPAFVPVLYGECLVGRGSVFGPHAGRMNLKLIPNNFQVLRMPHGRRLQALGGVTVLLTCLPVSMPSSLMLRTFRSLNRPAPCYPNILCDCECLEPVATIESSTSRDVGGQPVCCGMFSGDRILISTRKNGVPRGITEYDCDGHLIDVDILGSSSADMLKSVGAITMMISGHRNLACCGNNGYIMMLREERDRHNTDIKPVTKHGRSRYPWHKTPLLISAFTESASKSAKRNGNANMHVVCGCAVSHAGLDFFFIVAKSNEICVIVLDTNNGDCVRCAINSSFFISPIRSISACAPYLYIGLSDGDVYILNISPIIDDGDIDLVGYLHRFVVLHESIFAANAGIVSMCTTAPSTFLNLKNEDELINNANNMHRHTYKHTHGNVYKSLEKPSDDKYMQEHVEGHILLVGGGDQDPKIKVFHPKGGKAMHELVSLSGHNTAVTSIFADACMRYIVSASAQERKILIWDGYTFSCERMIEDVSIGSMYVGEDCMIVTTSKAPFIRIWNNPRSKSVVANNKPRVVMNSHDEADPNTVQQQLLYVQDEYRLRDIESECGIKYHHITALRSRDWCYSMLKGGFRPKKSIEIPKYLEPSYIQVLWRWSQQYTGNRMDAAESVATINQRRLDRKNRLNQKLGRIQPNTTSSADSGSNVLSSVLGGIVNAPPTPAAIRRGETPRARARRRFEKDQVGALLFLTEAANTNNDNKSSTNRASASEPEDNVTDDSNNVSALMGSSHVPLDPLEEGDEEKAASGKSSSSQQAPGPSAAVMNLNKFLHAAKDRIDDDDDYDDNNANRDESEDDVFEDIHSMRAKAKMQANTAKRPQSQQVKTSKLPAIVSTGKGKQASAASAPKPSRSHYDDDDGDDSSGEERPEEDVANEDWDSDDGAKVTSSDKLRSLVSKRYKAQFDRDQSNFDSDDENEELAREIRARREVFEAAQAEQERLERRKYVRPKGVQHMNDADEDV